MITANNIFLFFHIAILILFLLGSWILFRQLKNVTEYPSVRFYLMTVGVNAVQLLVTVLMITGTNENWVRFLLGFFYFLFALFIYMGYQFTYHFCGTIRPIRKYLIIGFSTVYFALTFFVSFFYREFFVEMKSKLPIYLNIDYFHIEFHPQALLGLFLPFLLLFSSSLLLVVQFLESGERFRRFVNLLVIPYSFYAIISMYVFMGEIPELFLTPFFCAVVMLLIGFILLYQEKVYSIAPTSRVKIMENTDCGILILDSFGYLIDINQIGRSIFGYNEEHARTHISKVYPQWNQLVKKIKKDEEYVQIVYQLEEEQTDKFYQVKAYRNTDKSMVLSVYDISEQKAMIDDLNYLAYHDGLTGLYNRVKFEDDFKQLQQKAKNELKNIAVIMIDMNGLKRINDNYGHAKGDAVLKVFSNYLRFVFPENASLARLGGDEFVVAIYDMEKDKLMTLAKTLMEKLQRDSSNETDGLNLNCSVGIATSGDTYDSDLRRSLMKRADFALYAAKKDPDKNIIIWDNQTALK